MLLIDGCGYINLSPLPLSHSSPSSLSYPSSLSPSLSLPPPLSPSLSPSLPLSPLPPQQSKMEETVQRTALQSIVRNQRIANARSKRYFKDYEMAVRGKLQRKRTRQEMVLIVNGWVGVESSIALCECSIHYGNSQLILLIREISNRTQFLVHFIYFRK